MAFESDADEMFFGGAGGGGKLLSLDCPIPTPSGFVANGDLCVGDEVFGRDGHVYRVTGLSPIVIDEAWRLTFDDGSTIIAHDDHRWLAYSVADLQALLKRSDAFRERRRASRQPSVRPESLRNPDERRGRAKKPHLAELNRARALAHISAPVTGRVIDTRTMVAALGGRQAPYAIPLCEPLQLPEKHLPLDPYLFGCWLGDGTSSGGEVTTADPEVVEAFAAVFQPGAVQHKQNNAASTYSFLGLRTVLRCMGVFQNKHVPEEYLWASEGQRLALLQGLLDTDGNVAGNSVEFVSTRQALTEGVARLVRSLGMKCRVRPARARLNGQDYGPTWRVKFVANRIVFRLPRKAAAQKLARRQTTRFRYLVGAERVGPLPMRCIAVDAPDHLYLAGENMVPTHNTELALGLALRKHTRAAIFRRTYGELSFIIDRLHELVPSDYGRFTVTTSRWTLYDKPGHIIELAGIEEEQHVSKWRGRPHDLKYFDEASEFLKDQFTWLTAWARTTDPTQKVRVLLGSNPPKGVEGYWLVERYAPWLDPRHPEFPVPVGELRWFAMLDDVDTLLEDGAPFTHEGELILPVSRTFIRSKVQDNPYQPPEYIARLQMLPEPLKGQILRGDFTIGMEDSAYQVIPTSWILAAVERGRNRERPPLPLSQVGVDVSRGGADWTIFARRAGNWILPLQRRAGINSQNGFEVAQHALTIVHGAPNRVPICVDMTGGWGNGPYDLISANWPDTYGVNSNVKVEARDRSGVYKMLNTRAYLWWSLREALDPANTTIDERDRIVLPDDPDLIVELAAPTYKTRQGGWLQVEGKDDIRKRLGRSTDAADAVLLSLFPVSDVTDTTMKRLATDPREAAMMGVDMRGWDDD